MTFDRCGFVRTEARVSVRRWLMSSRNKRRLLFVGLFVALIVALLSFFHHLTFLYTREDITSQVKEERNRAIVNHIQLHINHSLNYSSLTVVEEQATEVTTKDDAYRNPRANVSVIIDRRPQRIELDKSLKLDKVHFVIRTSTKFHHSRLELILLTWLQTAPPSNVSSMYVVCKYDASTALVC